MSIATRTTLEALEYPTLVELIASEARTDLGAARLRSLGPSADTDWIRRRRELHAEVERLVVEGPLVPSLDVEVAPLIARLESGREPLEGIEIVLLGRLLAAAGAAVERIRSADPACGELGRLAAVAGDPRPLVDEIGRILDPKGRVRDDASPRLVELSRQARGARERIYDRLEKMRSAQPELFSEETVPLRAGRLLLVLAAGSRGRLPGLVHGRSGSGRSFYFEPLEVVEENNVLQSALDEQDAERRRLLRELLRRLVEELPLVHALVEVIAELDAVECALRFAVVAEARQPSTAGNGGLRLVAARHPLVEPRLAGLRERVLGTAGHTGAIVPLDLELDAEHRLLVVTGPNAGGKTVALKTLGLLVLAAQSGWPIPCGAGTALPVFERVIAAVGDEQDLLAERSTFSGRLARMGEAWREAGPGCLTLVDELGSGTDPEEGAALSVALVERLLAGGGLGLVTTHLAMVAVAALEKAGAACAAMEFEPASGRPTFRMRPGAPGASEAISLARRLALPDEWIERAEQLVGGEHRDLHRVLAELEATRSELERRIAESERRTQEAQEAARLLESERAALEEKRRTLGHRLEAELQGFRERVSGRLGEAERKLQKQFAAGRRRGVAAKAVRELFAEAPQLAPEPEPAVAGEIETGGRVRHRALGWSGRLETLAGADAVVAVAGKRVRCRADDLEPLAEAERAPVPRPTVRGSVPSEAAASAVPAELLLLGQRVEEALEEVDDYLDRALAAGRAEVRIVHGHGTGRLRQAIRAHLRSHPAVASFRPGAPNEGGDGATIAVLSE